MGSKTNVMFFTPNFGVFINISDTERQAMHGCV